MSNEVTQPALQQAFAKTERSSEFRRIYSNIFRYKMTPSDVSIIFQFFTDNQQGPQGQTNVVVIEEAEIVMSHSQAKSFVLHLRKLIEAFEQEFGAIKSIGGPSDQVIQTMINGIKNVGFR